MNSLSAKSKFTMLVVLVAIFSILVIAFLGWRSSRDALNSAIFAQLTSVRTAKARQIEEYFTTMRSQIAVFSEDHMIVSAMVRLNRGYQELKNVALTPDEEDELAAYYNDIFIPSLDENLSEGTPAYAQFRPEGQAARYLQHRYIAANGNAIGFKHFTDDAGDGTAYSDFHAQYQPRLRELALRFHYYDLFLINIDSGEIVFSVFKETDYGTNLLTGPYRKSGLANVVRAVQENPTRQSAQVVDFQPYFPSHNAPAGFIAGPIYNGPHPVGILALQFPVDHFNYMMTGDNQWEADALGQSGETYLVGADRLMRSDSRFLLQDPDGFMESLSALGAPLGRLELIERLGTTILLQPIDTDASRSALGGEIDTRVIDDYRGVSVLSSFAPLNIEGLDWAIIAEIDSEEVFGPLRQLQNNLLIAAATLISLVALISTLLASNFLNPVTQMHERARQILEEDETLSFDTTATDEFGELANRLNEISSRARNLSTAAVEKEEKYENLLLKTLPAAVASRYERSGTSDGSGGGTNILDRAERVSVLYCALSGHETLHTLQDPERALAIQTELDDAFVSAAKLGGLDIFNQIGYEYVAVCGLTVPHLDHTRRAIDLALALMNGVTHFNLRHEANLSLQIGIDSGSAMGGLVGTQMVKYDVWGRTIEIAKLACSNAQANSVVITQSVYQTAQELYSLQPASSSTGLNDEEISLWEVVRADAGEGGKRNAADRNDPDREVRA